jgi:hypothetical protein
MRRVVIAALTFVLALCVAAPATAAVPTNRQLQAQITVMKRQIKTLTKQLKAETAARRTGVATALVYAGCETAVTADAIQGTWAAIDNYNTTHGGAAIFGPQQQPNDQQLCQTLQIRRAPQQATTAVFSQLLQLFA